MEFTSARAYRKEDGTYEFELPNETHTSMSVILMTVSNRKDLMSAAANMLYDITMLLSLSIPSRDTMYTADGLPEDMTQAFKKIGGLLQYMVNSTSYQCDSVQPFDVSWFSNELDNIKSSLLWNNRPGV
jgi:DNA-directed RNA polymerase subunit L